jgi:putative transposase
MRGAISPGALRYRLAKKEKAPMKRIPPSVQTQEQIEQLIKEGSSGADDVLSELVKLAVRRIVEEAMEGGVRDLLGNRGYYERRTDGQEGHRNGYRERGLKTSEGEVRYAAPQVRGISAEGLSALRSLFSGRTEELERLAVETFARGCSTRDIEDVFRATDGRTLLSRSAVSELTETLWAEYEAFASRDLGDIKPLYLYVDGVAERLQSGSPREAVLAAWAITWTGKSVLVHLSPGTKESTDCCRAFFEDMKLRGLGDPILVVTDGAPGLIRAAEECFPLSLRQRCLVHRVRNISVKLAEEVREAFKAAARAAYHAPSLEMASVLRDDLVRKYERSCPTAVACFLDDFEACVAHLRCPPGHRIQTRSTNLLERTFVEERRRMKAAIHVFGGERAVLKLMYASLTRSTRRWTGVTITELELAQLKRLRKELIEEHRLRTAPVATKGKRSAPRKNLQRG